MPIAFLHIFAGLLAITAGAFALAARKGGPLHKRSGIVFVYAMMAMTVAAGMIAAMHVEQRGNLVAAVITFYMVTTALLTVRPATPIRRWVDPAAMCVATALALLCLKFGLDAALAPKGKFFGYPALPTFILGCVAALAALGDARLLLGRVLDRHHRLARHLWRMCFGLFVATGSFFLGQAKVFPEALRIFPLLAIPALLPLVLMLYWLVRVRFLKRVPQATTTNESSGPTVAAHV